MRTLFPAVRVSDLETSLAFYEGIGMEGVGRVSQASTWMAMLALPREDEVTLELVERTGGTDGPRTVTLVDPDGHHLELVQWPDGHPVAMTRDDFKNPTEEEDR